MKQIFLIALVTSLTASCVAEPDNLITSSSVDHFRIGMSRAEIRRIDKSEKFSGSAPSECSMVKLEKPGFWLLFENDILNRIYIMNHNYTTDKGIKVGSNEAEVKNAYGATLKIEPHKYDPQGHYLSIIDEQGKGFMLETDGKTVDTISIGQTPALQYVEGCL